MRSKYLQIIASLILTIASYALLLPLCIFIRDLLGFENQIIFNVLNIFVFLFVYGIVSILVSHILNKINNQLLRIRKEAGGRDIVAEERHEDESGFISLSVKDK